MAAPLVAEPTDPAGPAAAGPVLHLLGGPYVSVGGCRREIPEGSKRLLVFVALRRCRRVERRHVAGVLWPVGSDERAAGNLRSALWRLRGADVDLMAVDKCTLGLRAEVVVDLETVADRAARLIAGTAGPGELSLTQSWSDALDLLPGWYEDWALVERERMRQRMLHGLEALSHHLVRAGRFAEAVEAAMTAVAVEPLRESAQRALVSAHLAEGNRIEALRCLDVHRTLLWRELGVEPATDLTALLRTDRPAQRLWPRRVAAGV